MEHLKNDNSDIAVPLEVPDKTPNRKMTQITEVSNVTWTPEMQTPNLAHNRKQCTKNAANELIQVVQN